MATTITARVCLDQLRARRRRDEIPLLAADIPDERLAADEEFIRREDVSRALMVVLDQLLPSQRVAFVLHDLFGVPFERIADTLGTTTVNAKKLASRARARLGTRRPAVDGAGEVTHRQVVTAFLEAARGGDMAGMIALMAPDCVRVADSSLLPRGVASTVSGARAVAEETSAFKARIRASVTMLVNGRMVDVIAPGGHALAGIDVRVDGRQIISIIVTAIRRTDQLAAT